MLIALLVVLALIALSWTLGAWSNLPTGRHCHDCGQQTLPLTLGRWLRPFSRELARRWCPRCGWEGLRRINVRPQVNRAAHASGFRWRSPEKDLPPILWNDDPGSDRSNGPPA